MGERAANQAVGHLPRGGTRGARAAPIWRVVATVACTSSLGAACTPKPAQPPAGPNAASSLPRAWPYVASPRPAASDAPGGSEPTLSNWVPPGRTARYGHGSQVVPAPPARVRARLLDYAHYKTLAGPKFRTVRVVDRRPDGTDLYFQLPVLRGLVTIQYVARFRGPLSDDRGAELIEGTFVSGNIRDAHVVFTIEHADADASSTLTTCDLMIAPVFPVPGAALDEELRDACGDVLRTLVRTVGANAE